MEIFMTLLAYLTCIDRLKLLMLTMYILPLMPYSIKKSFEMQRNFFKIIITARDYTNRFLRVKK